MFLKSTIEALKSLFRRKSDFTEFFEKMAGGDLEVYAVINRKHREHLTYALEVIIHNFVAHVAEDKKEAEVFRACASNFLDFLAGCDEESQRKK